MYTGGSGRLSMISMLYKLPVTESALLFEKRKHSDNDSQPPAIVIAISRATDPQ